jgi:dUTP pyrophosphatase
MKAIPVERNDDDNKELLSSLLDLMGNLDGGSDQPDFQETKQQIMDSGITPEGLFELMGNNLAGVVARREVYPVHIQLLTDTAIVPTYAHLSDACCDIYADEDVTIASGETYAVSTGIALAIPDGFVCHVYPRSGLSMKTGLRLANSTGIIDAGYRDELKVLIWNTSEGAYHIEKGMRIAQMDIMPSPAMDFYEVEDVKAIGENRNGGFGSSGLFDIAGVKENGKV